MTHSTLHVVLKTTVDDHHEAFVFRTDRRSFMHLYHMLICNIATRCLSKTSSWESKRKLSVCELKKFTDFFRLSHTHNHKQRKEAPT